jgi:hypothetical protein
MTKEQIAKRDKTNVCQGLKGRLLVFEQGAKITSKHKGVN